MDFFAHQDRARRRTGLLLVYMALAVVLIVLAVYAAVWLVVNVAGPATLSHGGMRGLGRGHPGGTAGAPFFLPDLFLWVSAGTLAVIAGGTLYKTMELRGGGASVARMLGGTLVARNTVEFAERQLLNVVEEMAIAAGTAVPPVYVLGDEPGINAFAAGYTPGDAVIGVTRGCLQRLTRDELQGVIAHEFSHILNGDMRLNLRLMGILHGILLIALIGYGILRGVARSGVRSSRRGKGGGGGVLVALLLGLALIVIGYIGVFFAKLIQSAVSRQREFLADASAVQFTRNPGGIAGALKKIGGLSHGSRVDEPLAAEASHLFFGNALAPAWFRWLATHPPLEERIRRIDPSFDGRMTPPEPAPGGAPRRVGISYEEASRQARAAAGPARRIPLHPGAVVAMVGAPTGDHLAYAARVREGLPAPVASAIETAAGAQAVLSALLLSSDAQVRAAQLQRLERDLGAEARAVLEKVQASVAGLPRSQRMPLLDLAIPALKELPAMDLRRFSETVRALAEADREIDLFEYTLQTVLEHRLRGWLEPSAQARVEYFSLTTLRQECRLLLSALAHLGRPGVPAERAFQAAAASLGTVGALGLVPAEECTLAAVDQALARLAHLAHPLRGRILAACAEVVLADRMVEVEEAELLRAIAAALDCPMPPIAAAEPRAA